MDFMKVNYLKSSSLYYFPSKFYQLPNFHKTHCVYYFNQSFPKNSKRF